MTGARSETALAFAKINPILRVLGRRDDGYHEIETLLVALDLADRVQVTERAEGGDLEGPAVTVRTSGSAATSDIADDGNHLAVRGAALALDVLDSGARLHVEVSKEIPSRAGLGGGSSDAVAAAFAALRLLAPRADFARLADACASRFAEIGMDCAFFAHAMNTGAGFGAGRGDRLVPLEGRLDWEVLVVTPGVTCSTPTVYGALGLAHGDSLMAPAGIDAAERLLGLTADEARDELVNGLERAAVEAEPDLARWFEMLDDLGFQHMRLAGSGSSLFGLFDPTNRSAHRAAEDIQKEAPARGLGFRFLRVLKPARAGVGFTS